MLQSVFTFSLVGFSFFLNELKPKLDSNFYSPKFEF